MHSTLLSRAAKPRAGNKAGSRIELITLRLSIVPNDVGSKDALEESHAAARVSGTRTTPAFRAPLARITGAESRTVQGTAYSHRDFTIDMLAVQRRSAGVDVVKVDAKLDGKMLPPTEMNQRRVFVASRMDDVEEARPNHLRYHGGAAAPHYVRLNFENTRTFWRKI